MKVEYKGLTDEGRLISTMLEFDKLGTPRHVAKEIILPMMERCVEVWADYKLAGYLLIFNSGGRRSFHGYKLIKGYAVFALRAAKEFVDRYPHLYITHHTDRPEVNRFARLLGFTEINRDNQIVILEKNNVRASKEVVSV